MASCRGGVGRCHANGYAEDFLKTVCVIQGSFPGGMAVIFFPPEYASEGLFKLKKKESCETEECHRSSVYHPQVLVSVPLYVKLAQFPLHGILIVGGRSWSGVMAFCSFNLSWIAK